MRRKDKEITSLEEIVGIISRCKICRVAMCRDGVPYIVPVNFGYSFADGQVQLYIHGAKVGKKNAILAENANVCVEFDIDSGVIAAEKACDFGYAFESVICLGTALPVAEPEAKRLALDALMRQMTGEQAALPYPDSMLEATAVYRIAVAEITGKRKRMQPGR